MIPLGAEFADYRLEAFLGKGKSGNSYLAAKAGRKAVIKIIHDEPCPYYRFADKLESELAAYERLLAAGIHVPALLEFGRGEKWLAKEYIGGDTGAALAASGSGGEAARQLFEMSGLAKKSGFNLDWFPCNFILSGKTLWYIDYETNPYSDEWSLENWGLYYWANAAGMKRFIETGDAACINADIAAGKPHKTAGGIVKQWIADYKS